MNCSRNDLDRDWNREAKEIGLEAFSRQHDDSPFETELAKVAIEGEDMVESMMVDQSKARAVNEAKIFVLVSNENRLGRLFNRFANTKNFDAGLVERLHEFNGRLVTDFEANQCVGLGENEIGGKS